MYSDRESDQNASSPDPAEEQGVYCSEKFKRLTCLTYQGTALQQQPSSTILVANLTPQATVEGFSDHSHGPPNGGHEEIIPWLSIRT